MGTGTGLGRVRGLGSAHKGPGHWIHQRQTAMANLLLLVWFIVSIARLPVIDHQAVVLWIKSPFVAVPLVLLVISVFTHIKIGLTVFLEDYLHEEGGKIAAMLALNAYVFLCGALCVFSILKIAFGGVPA